MKKLYKNLAVQNLKKNKTVYLPYMMAQMLMAALFYNLLFLAENKDILILPGGQSIRDTLDYGALVMGIFVMIFLFYVNSFLIKQRTKEFGLYRVLGMEQKHLKKVVLYETSLASAISFGTGIVAGILFSGLLYMILLHILGAAATLSFGISGIAIWVTFLLFGFLYVLILLYNYRRLKKVNLREMLQEGERGEREPKSKKGVMFIGIVSLIIGYGIALIIQNVFASLVWFFIATVFVILGTYTLFTAGSIIFLKKIKEDEKKYYTPKFFTAVSGLLHRMKQNAAGLAGICILSTMILVTCAVSISVYFGQEQAIKTTFPSDIIVTMSGSKDADKDMKYIERKAEEAAGEAGISVDEVKFAPLTDVEKDMQQGQGIRKVQVSLSGDDKGKYDCSRRLNLNPDDKEHTYQVAYANCKQSPTDGAESLRASYGGFLFLGIFMGVMFMTATVLMIYYKQISEGYEDRKRYVIMKKVGMSDEEVEEAIQNQVLLVFFLPLVMAGIHILAALKCMAKICSIMSIGFGTVFLCTVGTVFIFSLIYMGVYRQTAKVYYNIVDQK